MFPPGWISVFLKAAGPSAALIGAGAGRCRLRYIFVFFVIFVFFWAFGFFAFLLPRPKELHCKSARLTDTIETGLIALIALVDETTQFGTMEIQRVWAVVVGVGVGGAVVSPGLDGSGIWRSAKAGCPSRSFFRAR